MAGALSLFTSQYSDDLIDVVSAFVAMNGVFATLSHATLLRILGRADALSINLGVLLYTRCLVHATFPTLARRRVPRGMLDLLVVLAMCMSVAWTTDSVPAFISQSIDGSIAVLCLCAPISLAAVHMLAYGRATWHMGKIKRVFLSCLLYTSPNPRDRQKSRMPSSA